MLKKEIILPILPKSHLQERDEFIHKVWKLSKEYGHNQIFLAFSVPKDSQNDIWMWKTTSRLDDLKDFLEESVIPSLED